MKIEDPSFITVENFMADVPDAETREELYDLLGEDEMFSPELLAALEDECSDVSLYLNALCEQDIPDDEATRTGDVAERNSDTNKMHRFAREFSLARSAALQAEYRKKKDRRMNVGEEERRRRRRRESGAKNKRKN